LLLNSDEQPEGTPESVSLHQQLTAVLSGAMWERGNNLSKWPTDEAAIYRLLRYERGNLAARELRMRKAATAALTLIRANGLPEWDDPETEALRTVLQTVAAEHFRTNANTDDHERQALEHIRQRRLSEMLTPFHNN
jgi:hypothetical protein